MVLSKVDKEWLKNFNKKIDKLNENLEKAHYKHSLSRINIKKERKFKRMV